MLRLGIASGGSGFQVQKFLGLLKLHSPMQIHCDQCKAMGDLLLVNTLPPATQMAL